MNSKPFEIVEINPKCPSEQLEWEEAEIMIDELLAILVGDHD